MSEFVLRLVLTLLALWPPARAVARPPATDRVPGAVRRLVRGAVRPRRAARARRYAPPAPRCRSWSPARPTCCACSPPPVR